MNDEENHHMECEIRPASWMFRGHLTGSCAIAIAIVVFAVIAAMS
jgi:hypothetical protein